MSSSDGTFSIEQAERDGWRVQFRDGEGQWRDGTYIGTYRDHDKLILAPRDVDIGYYYVHAHEVRNLPRERTLGMDGVSVLKLTRSLHRAEPEAHEARLTPSGTVTIKAVDGKSLTRPMKWEDACRALGLTRRDDPDFLSGMDVKESSNSPSPEYVAALKRMAETARSHLHQSTSTSRVRLAAELDYLDRLQSEDDKRKGDDS